MRCARCGSMNFVMVPRKKYSWSIAIISMIIIALVILPAFPLGLLLGFIGKTKNVCVCNNCRNTWNM